MDPRYVIQKCDINDSASESNESRPAFLLRILTILSCNSGDNKSVTVPRGAGYLTEEIAEFIAGLRRCDKNIYGKELPADTGESFRQLFSAWNTFLQLEQEIRGISVIISSDIKEDINKFIWQEELAGAQLTENYKRMISDWLPRWNMFLQARADETLVTHLNVCLTIMGFILYMADQVSDIGTSIYYARIGEWWRAVVTLIIVYGAVIISTVVKWIRGELHCTGSADWLRYVASLLFNWPDVKQYGALCLLEWKLHKSPTNSARLVPEWHQRRHNVARLKFTEGLCEACPQAILQLCLLVPELYEDLTWTDYLRIAAASISLCTAGAALVNEEKFYRIYNNIDLPLSELIVLHAWAVPVTVSRLLSVALLLTVDPYWTLAGVVLHLVLYGVHWYRTVGGPRALSYVIIMCQVTLQFFISPFDVSWCITYRRVFHAIHFLGNTTATVVWAFSTPLVCAHTALYTAVICFNAVMFAVGLLGWQLHKKYWPGSYIIPYYG